MSIAAQCLAAFLFMLAGAQFVVAAIEHEEGRRCAEWVMRGFWPLMLAVAVLVVTG